MAGEQFYKSILENFYEGVYFVDRDRKITFWNHGAERITGFNASEVVGKYCFDNILNHVDDFGRQLCLSGCPLHQTIDDGQMREVNVYLHHKAGHRVPVTVRTIPITEGDQVLGAVEVFVDDSEKIEMIKNMESYKVLAMYDQLTGIANRRFIDTFIASKISEYVSLGIDFGIGFIDIDKFKDFNDNYGHLIGDEIIKMVANTLSSVVRNTDLIGRWGGEEFVAVVVGADVQVLEKIFEKMRMLVESSSLRIQRKRYSVTISIGFTMYSESETSESLVLRADDLLFKSKNNGRNCITLG